MKIAFNGALTRSESLPVFKNLLFSVEFWTNMISVNQIILKIIIIEINVLFVNSWLPLSEGHFWPKSGQFLTEIRLKFEPKALQKVQN